MVQKLIDGFTRFHKRYYEDDDTLMTRLMAEGQKPEFFVISCMDSRSLPGIIFDAQPGTFFPFTPMGAIIRPYKQGTALAAGLEFAIENIGVKQIVVLGHTGCGAIEALVGASKKRDIGSFVDVAKEGFARAQALCGGTCSHEKLLRLTEEQVVLMSAENLRTYPGVAKGLGDGSVQIHKWIFDMTAGALKSYDIGSQQFLPITAPALAGAYSRGPQPK